MIRFVNLETGNIYNGDTPYIHWFNGEQSTDLIYTQPICFISSTKHISVRIDSDVFSLLDTSLLNNELIDVNSFKYHDIKTMKSNKVNIEGVSVDEKGNYYVYIIYFMGCSSMGAEFIDDFIISECDEEYSNILREYSFKIGADFYKEDESLYINLSNFGIEIPESVQKAIYYSNVHEDQKDNILLNRKFKELLSNYWDMIANKGSYKSLVNSLKWFEWGDIVRLCEIWKHDDFGKTIYSDRPIKSILEDKYMDSLSKFAKTTYMSLYVTMQNLMDGEYDSEMNPKLKHGIFNWSKIDLSLKMSMLGHFYETYFMPIHLDLIHSTIEDIVFTNTIKIINGGDFDREDYWCNAKSTFKCNIKNGDGFKLSNVMVGVDHNTLFGTRYNNETEYDHIHIVGVKPIEDVGVEATSYDNDPTQSLQTFWSQNYSGVGVIIPIKCELELEEGDYIFKEILHAKINGSWKTRENNFIYKHLNNQLTNIDFNLLICEEGPVEIRLEFHSAYGRTFVKVIGFNVYDTLNTTLSLYKIKHIDEKELVNAWEGGAISNKYMFTTAKELSNVYYKQILNTGYGGVAMNHILVLEDDQNQIDKNIVKQLEQYYFVTTRVGERNEEKTPYKYYVCVSKKYWFDYTTLPNFNIIKPFIYKETYGYFPEFHYLEPFPSSYESIDDLTINQYDTLAVIPTISHDDKTRIDYEFGKGVDDGVWEFINMSTGEVDVLDNPIAQPIVAGGERILNDGYYSVKFKYKLGDNEQELLLNSAFLKKSI